MKNNTKKDTKAQLAKAANQQSSGHNHRQEQKSTYKIEPFIIIDNDRIKLHMISQGNQ